MSADLATIDGKIAFASHRVDAWHRTGYVGDLTLDTMLPLANLNDWNLELVPSLAQALDGTTVPVPGKKAVLRTRDNTPLGVVGDSYHLFSNEALLDLARSAVAEGLIDETMMQAETAGAIRGGRIVFLVFSLPRDVWTISDDPHMPYFTLVNGHDGSTAVRALATTVRVVCKNTLEAGIAKASREIRFAHRSGVATRAQEVAKAVGLAVEQVQGYQTFADHILHSTMIDAEFDALLAGLIPPVDDDASKRAVTVRNNNVAAIRKIYETAPTVGKFKGTKWGAFQAVNEFEGWFQGSTSQDSRARGERAIMAAVKGRSPLTVKARDLLVPDTKTLVAV